MFESLIFPGAYRKNTAGKAGFKPPQNELNLNGTTAFINQYGNKNRDLKDIPILVVFHGNNSQAEYNLEAHDKTINILRKTNQDFAVLAVEYNSYANPKIKPSEKGIKQDADNVYNALIKQGINPKNLTICGESLGSVPALHLATKHAEPKYLINSPLASTYDVAKQRLQQSNILIQLIAFPLCLLLYPFVDKLNNREQIKNVSNPENVTIFVDQKDKTLPPELHARKLERLNPAVSYLELSDTTSKSGMFHVGAPGRTMLYEELFSPTVQENKESDRWRNQEAERARNRQNSSLEASF